MEHPSGGKMKIQIIDGEVTEVTQQDWQAFEAWRKEQAKDWPQGGDDYWFIDAEGDVDEDMWSSDGLALDTGRKSIGNIYRTEAEALAQVEKLKAKARIDKYIADNGLAFVPDWKEVVGKKWVIHYKCVSGYFAPECFVALYYATDHVFATEAHAIQVIDNCTDDLKTLFGVK